MSVKFRHRDRSCGGVAAVCAAVLPVVADAQDAAIDRMAAIERQMRTLQSEHERQMRTFQTELQRLKSELGEARRQLRQSQTQAQRDLEDARQAREAADQPPQDAEGRNRGPRMIKIGTSMPRHPASMCFTQTRTPTASRE